MKIGDKVHVIDEPMSLPVKCAGMVGEITKHGFGDNWLVRLDENLWWAKGYDIEVVVDDEKFSEYVKKVKRKKVKE